VEAKHAPRITKALTHTRAIAPFNLEFGLWGASSQTYLQLLDYDFA